uniref:Uncharacterized protein n=1 Tax=Candidatus Kentrum sp. TC TaxID=2126339 RepID=A0A450YK77_9GAMM|nr:MAG: hypothetical protein BECKTC1821D_GA0114238_101146 [Candidatus Kentron sp. TC]
MISNAMKQLFQNHPGFALCIENTDCGDLEKGKVYPVFSDDAAGSGSGAC